MGSGTSTRPARLVRVASMTPPLPRRLAEGLFGGVALGAAILSAVVLALVVYALASLAMPGVRALGLAPLASSVWNPDQGRYGLLAFAAGTMVSAILALVLAVPVALGVAFFLSDLGPPRLRKPVGIVVDLLSAVPSVVYGTWAALVLVPLLRTTIEPMLERTLGFLPIFRGPHIGVGMLCAAIVLAIMVVPTVAAVAREVLDALPDELREGGLALGATPWELVARVVAPHAKRGLLGAVVVGFGRATSESLAVAMVIGSRADLKASLFEPSYTLGSVIVNEFAETDRPLQLAVLAEAGCLLLLVTIGVHVVARSLVRGTATARTS